MAEEQKIRSMAETLLQDESHYIVDVQVSSGRSGGKVRILLDGDEGVSIDDCARLSRELGERMEAEEIFGNAYTLEVSTPGIDYPLGSVRQYRKNIGRELKVTTEDGRDLKGVLSEVKDKAIVLEVKIGKGKKASTEKVEVPLSGINKSIVQISFK